LLRSSCQLPSLQQNVLVAVGLAADGWQLVAGSSDVAD
jgi:hypothetical protein